ncbi:MAG: hypothetical protein SH820_07185 [Xanthomonadales bacterium]|nr:hypothetical protein [Xanthomonadales bacterium]
MSIAALTSALGMLKSAVSWLAEHRGPKRTLVAIVEGEFIWLFGIPALLSFKIWSGFTPLNHIAGWAISKESRTNELSISVDSYTVKGWSFLVGDVAPITIFSIFIFNITTGAVD